MAHPAQLLAVANACHRDMDPATRTRTLRAVVATLEDPPRSIASIPDGCHAETAMEVLDHLEYSMAPHTHTDAWTRPSVDTHDTLHRLAQATVVLLLAVACVLLLSSAS